MPIAPLPMAIGVIVMLVIGRGRHVAHRPGAGAGRLAALPGRRRASTPSTSAALGRGSPAPRSCAPGSPRSRTSPSTARWWSRRSAGRTPRPSASPRRATSCATPTSPSAGSAACSTRCSRRCPTSGCWRCCCSARPGRRRRHASRRRRVRSPTCSPCWPSRSARSAGCSASCRAPSSAGSGSARCWTPQERTDYGTAHARRRRAGALEVDDVGSATPAPTGDVLRGRRPAPSSRAAPSRSSAPTGARQVHPGALLARLVDPDGRRGPAGRRRRPRARAKGRSRRGRARPAADVPVRRHRARQRTPRRGRPTRSGLGRAARWRRPSGSSTRLPDGLDTRHRRARHDPVRRPAPAPGPGPRAGAPAAAAGAGRRHLGVDPRVEAAHPRGLRDAPARGRGHGRGRRLPQGHHRARRRGGLPRARPRRRTAGTHAELLGARRLPRSGHRLRARRRGARAASCSDGRDDADRRR